MFERFTERARQVVVLAQDEARTLRHNYIGTEHILLGLLREEEGPAARALESLGIVVEEVRAQVVRIVGQGDKVVTGQIPFTPRAKKVLELELRRCPSDGQYVGPEHPARPGRETGSARVLGDLGTDADSIRAEVIRGLGMSGQGRPAELPQTPGARTVLRLAQDEARGLGHDHVGTEHILLGLLGEEEGAAAQVLATLDVTIEEVRAQVARIVVQGDDASGDEIRLTEAATWVVELAAAEALSLGQNHIGTEHLLLALVRDNEGIAVRILLDFDVDAEKVRNEIARILSASERIDPALGQFTHRARQVVTLAADEARTLKHNYIGTEHILLGLLREEEGLAARVLDTLDITVEEVRAQVARIVGQGDEVTTGQIPFTPRAKKVLELALREALSLGHNYIGTEHILLGLVRENEGVAARILLDFDADAEKIRNEIIRMLSGPGRRAAAGVTRGPVVVNIPCPACGRSLEQLQLTQQEGGTFTAERSGAAHCRHCDARFDLSYRIEWKPA